MLSPVYHEQSYPPFGIKKCNPHFSTCQRILSLSGILPRLEIMEALSFVRSDGLKIGGTKWKELKLWAGKKNM
jgi:hypothetical protein